MAAIDFENIAFSKFKRISMNIDTGLAIVIIAVLIFYLRLIILQRERAKQMAKPAVTSGKKKSKSQPEHDARSYSVISSRSHDRIIAGVGAAAILIGILLYAKILPFPALQSYWWVPTAFGIVAFSWAFKL